MTSNDAVGYAIAFTFGSFGVVLLSYAAWLAKEIFRKKK